MRNTSAGYWAIVYRIIHAKHAAECTHDACVYSRPGSQHLCFALPNYFVIDSTGLTFWKVNYKVDILNSACQVRRYSRVSMETKKYYIQCIMLRLSNKLSFSLIEDGTVALLIANMWTTLVLKIVKNQGWTAGENGATVKLLGLNLKSKLWCCHKGDNYLNIFFLVVEITACWQYVLSQY